MREFDFAEPLPGFQMLGHDSNAFALMGSFARYAKRAGMPKEQIDEVLAEARSGDYDNLLATLMQFSEDGAGGDCRDCGAPDSDCECDEAYGREVMP